MVMMMVMVLLLQLITRMVVMVLVAWVLEVGSIMRTCLPHLFEMPPESKDGSLFFRAFCDVFGS